MTTITWVTTTALVLGILNVCAAQNRPFYAARPVQYPTLINRFGEGDGELNNRVGEAEVPAVRPVVFVGGSVVDQDLIDRVATWPRDKQPFWFVNSQAIQSHVSNSPSASSFNRPPPQSSFLSG